MKFKTPIFIKMTGFVLVCSLTFALLVGCAPSENQNQTAPTILESQGNQAYHDILVVLPLATIEDGEAPDTPEQIEEMLQATQEYFNTTMLDLTTPTFYFVPLRGEYNHANEEMELVGAIVNRQENTIVSFSGQVRMQTDVADMQIATVTLDLPPEFIGELRPNEALLISLSVPVRGLSEDQIFEAFQFRAELSDIAVIEGWGNSTSQSITLTIHSLGWWGHDELGPEEEPPAPTITTREITLRDTVAFDGDSMRIIEVRDEVVVVRFSAYGIAPLTESGTIPAMPKDYWIAEITYGEAYFISTSGPSEGIFWTLYFDKY